MSSITQYKVPIHAKMVLNGAALVEIDLEKQAVDDGILFPAGESYIAFDELCHIHQRERRSGLSTLVSPRSSDTV